MKMPTMDEVAQATDENASFPITSKFQFGTPNVNLINLSYM